MYAVKYSMRTTSLCCNLHYQCIIVNQFKNIFRYSNSRGGNGYAVDGKFEQPRLLPTHWNLLGRSSTRQMLTPEDNEKHNGHRPNGEITDDGNYSRPAGTSARSVFITR